MYTCTLCCTISYNSMHTAPVKQKAWLPCHTGPFEWLVYFISGLPVLNIHFIALNRKRAKSIMWCTIWILWAAKQFSNKLYFQWWQINGDWPHMWVYKAYCIHPNLTSKAQKTSEVVATNPAQVKRNSFIS